MVTEQVDVPVVPSGPWWPLKEHPGHAGNPCSPLLDPLLDPLPDPLPDPLSDPLPEDDDDDDDDDELEEQLQEHESSHAGIHPFAGTAIITAINSSHGHAQILPENDSAHPSHFFAFPNFG